MAAHLAVFAVAACVIGDPVMDKIAGAFPQILPLAIAVTVTDVGCTILLRAPTYMNILQIISDAATVTSDVRQMCGGRSRC
jgi:hypothetical protein